MRLSVDLDGTLTNETPDLVFFKSKEETEEACMRCTLKPGVEVLRERNVSPVIITGREEYLREVTTKFLKAMNVPFSDLIMFPERKSPNGFKWREYLGYKLKAHVDNNITAALEDNAIVVKVLNSKGIITRQVGGSFRSAFDSLREDCPWL
jgi:hypothetical protein